MIKGGLSGPVVDCILVRPHCTIVEWQVTVHHYLVEIKNCSLVVDKNRFLVFSCFSDRHRSFPHNEHLKNFLFCELNNLASVYSAIGEAHHKVTYEALLAFVTNWFQRFDNITEQKIDNHKLILVSAQYPETILLNNHVKVICDGG